MTIDGLVLLKGDHTSQISNILSTFGYTSAVHDKTITFSEAMDSQCISVGVVFYKDWTIVYDKYCGLLQSHENYKKWKKWSLLLDTNLFILEYYSVVSKSIYCIYDKGQVRRAYCSIDNEVKVNVGSPPSIEVQITERILKQLCNDKDIDQNIGVLGEHDLFTIMKKLTGIDYIHDEDLHDAIDATDQYFDN